jgi:pyridoxine kinase
VQFSNHTGYGEWKGAVFEPKVIRDVVAGIEARGVLGECDSVLSGYIGSAEIGEAILEAVASVKRANPAARYCCDPVLGDVEQGMFVRKDVPPFMKTRALPAADVITPNQFELDYLSEQTTKTIADVKAALDALHALGPRGILATSMHTAETPEDHVDTIVSDRTGRFRVRTPLLPVSINGAGDAIAALFLFQHLQRESIAEALACAVSALFGVLQRTAEAGSREILLVEAQEELVAPTRLFEAEAI